MDLIRVLIMNFLEFESDSFRLKFQKHVANRLVFGRHPQVVCWHHWKAVSDLSRSSCVLLKHPVTVWELIGVLFSGRSSGRKPVGAHWKWWSTRHGFRQESKPLDEALQWSPGYRFDISFYLMPLHANQDENFGLLKTMFSAFSSSCDPLDYHMIRHQRSILEAIGAFSSNDLHFARFESCLSITFVLGCVIELSMLFYTCHISMTPHTIHVKLIREVLPQWVLL
jgi:hypothetical protein